MKRKEGFKCAVNMYNGTRQRQNITQSKEIRGTYMTVCLPLRNIKNYSIKSYLDVNE